MKTEIRGYSNLIIEKYYSDNITILAGRPGSGKTYQINQSLEFDISKKLLLASASDCENEYLTVDTIKKIPYCKTEWETSVLENFTSLLNILETHVSKSYDLIIMDNVPFESFRQINTLLKLCLEYPNTKFYLLFDKLLEIE